MGVGADRESFSAYCRRDRVALVRLAHHLTGSRADGEDLAQDVLERLAQGWERVSRLDNVDAYARRALINLSRTRHRRRAAEARALARISSPAPDGLLPTTVEGDDQLWAAVRRLPGWQPAIVSLVILEDRTHAEVAGILGISAANARQSYRRAIGRLRARVRERA